MIGRGFVGEMAVSGLGVEKKETLASIQIQLAKVGKVADWIGFDFEIMLIAKILKGFDV